MADRDNTSGLSASERLPSGRMRLCHQPGGKGGGCLYCGKPAEDWGLMEECSKRQRGDELLINGDEVEEVFCMCLYRKASGRKVAPGDAVFVEGIEGEYIFSSELLEKHRQKIEEWLRALPYEFRRNKGGGWSFLNACYQNNGVQWTDYQERVEQLLCMAIGLKLAKCLLSREFWYLLPGAMPYYAIFVE